MCSMMFIVSVVCLNLFQISISNSHQPALGHDSWIRPNIVIMCALRALATASFRREEREPIGEQYERQKGRLCNKQPH